MTNEPTPITSARPPRPEPPKSISAPEWIELLFDEGSFDERFAAVRTPDPLHFSDSQAYTERLAETREQTGGREAVWTGSARLGGQNVIVAVSDFRFIGGSMGFAVGERVTEAMAEARDAEVPFIAVTCSGGARMQEGMVALLQMAKTAAAAQRLHEAGVPLITVLAGPTTGGVYASYGNQGDVIVAEAGALIGFAGPRVRAVHDADEPRETLYAEDLLEAGQVDAVLPREAMRDYLLRVARLLRPMPAADPERLPPFVQARGLERGWTVVERARHADRPRALRFIEGLASDYVPLHGDRSGVDDPALVGGLARIGETNVVVLGQERGDLDLLTGSHDGRVTPAGYRKARRLMLLAQRLGLPLVTFVDTPGAHDGIADEWGGLASSISDCLATMSSLTVPTVSIVIGEGGSGGALALTVADRILMLQNSMYAITSPEGAAAILFRDRGRAAEVAEALGVAAVDLHQLGIVDTVVPEPLGGAQTDPQAAVRMLEPELRRALAEAMRGRGTARRSRREERIRRIGRSPGTLRQAAVVLAGATDTAVHAINAGVQAIGSRIRRRAKTADPAAESAD
ncbi:MAG: acetyl-CoA carboxylase carboxyl transferase subunit beta [Dehalococcoidia bacterium]|nr:acetyl-CoA carboxylase carboxyl transferase subunit beta [Dehalococcoidia bacterium]